MHAVLVGLLLLAGCDAGAFAPGTDSGYPSLRLHANVASTTVAELSVEVAAPDISPPLIFNIPVSSGAANGTVQAPTGSNRQFTLRAYDAGGVETHRGSETVNILHGSNPPLTVTLNPLQGEREIDATLASIVVVVTPAADTTAVGDSLRLGASVIDSLGNFVSHGSVHWATLGPSVATVDSRGMVFGVGPGEARIVATYGSVGGSSLVSVVEPTSPGTVHDLAAIEASANSVTLEWTQVDNGMGEPAHYAIRNGSPTISWGSAHGTQVAVEGTGIGQPRRFTYEGLETGTDYQFQLVSYRGTLETDATFGNLSNVAGAATAPTEPGTPSTIIVSPSWVTINGLGNTAQLSAEARDSAGNVVANVSFEWSSREPGIASVSEEGLVTSSGFGSTVIVATLLCGSVACEGGLFGESTVQVDEQGEGQTLFTSNWSTALGPASEAVRDGGRWNMWYCGFGHDVLEVVAGAPHGWTLTSNVLQVTMRGEQCGQLEENNAVPHGVDYYIRAYIMVLDAQNNMNNHPYKTSFSGAQGVMLWAIREPTGPEGTYRPAIRVIPSQWTDPDVNQTYAIQYLGPRLSQGEWYRFEHKIEYVGDPSLGHTRVFPRVYDASNNLVADENHFFWLEAGNKSLAQSYADGAYRDHPEVDGSVFNAITRPSLGYEGPAGAPMGSERYFFAGIEVRTGSWPGPLRP